MSETEAPQPGIYFGASAAAYNSWPALSNSAMKYLAIDPLEFWMQSPMVNPNAVLPPQTKPMGLGTAWHVLVVEGMEAFEARYAPALDRSEYPDCLDTADQIKAALKSLGVSGYSKMAKAELVDALLEANPAAKIWEVEQGKYAEAVAPRTIISREDWSKIRFAGALIHNDAQIAPYFQNGYPEVAVVWHDPDTGCLLKCRLDYMRIDGPTELKTFNNMYGRPIDAAVAQTMENQRYARQAAMQCRAIEAARAMLIEAGPAAAFGDVDPDWLEEFAESEETLPIFVFQSTSIAPIACRRRFRRELTVFREADAEITRLTRRFMRCKKHFPPGQPWYFGGDVKDFTNDDFWRRPVLDEAA